MSNSQIGTVRPKEDAVGPLTLNFLVARLSDGDRRVRRSAAAALRNLSDAKAVDPLVFALSWELTLGAGSYPVVIKIIDTLAKTPNRRALDALEKAESRMTDRESAGCPILLPQDVVTYHDMGDGHIQLAVPRKLHYKVLDVMRRISVKINYRQEEMEAQLDEYQRETLQAEVDRIMPILTPVFQDYDQPTAYLANTFNDVGQGNVDGGHFKAELQPGDSVADVADIDIDAIRHNAETEISNYLCGDEEMLTLIRNRQQTKTYTHGGKGGNDHLIGDNMSVSDPKKVIEQVGKAID